MVCMGVVRRNFGSHFKNLIIELVLQDTREEYWSSAAFLLKAYQIGYHVWVVIQK